MLVDLNAYLGRWPLYPPAVSDAQGLIDLMDRNGIAAAFVSNLEGLFLLDPAVGNAQLAAWVAEHRTRLLPVGTLNPSLENWEADACDAVERCHVAGIRLHPSYHGYALDLEAVAALAGRLAEWQLPLFLSVFVDEERFQHPALRASNVPVADLIRLIRRAPETTIVLNNLTVDEAEQILNEPGLPLDRVAIDIAAMDKPFDGLARLLDRFGNAHLVYGSQMPFLYPEAARALVQENDFDRSDVHAILEGNWRRYAALAARMTG